jgi:hypothetical protein
VTKEKSLNYAHNVVLGAWLSTNRQKLDFLVLKKVIMKGSLLGCNYIQFGDSMTFQRNTLPSSPGLKNKPSNKSTETNS